MAQNGDPIHIPEESVGFHTCVTDAISEWKELYQSKEDSFNRECRGRDPGAPPLTHPNEDCVRVELLKQLITLYCVSFEDWCTEEVLTFAMFACPRKNLQAATEAGKDLGFLAVLHGNWKPYFLDWAYFLWEFVGRACELFADVLFLMPQCQKPKPSILGKVLFKDMIVLELVPPAACASFIGALLLHPYESTYARKHEENIHLYSEHLGRNEIAFMCRSLLLYRSRDPDRCDCGYRRGEYECKCLEKKLQHNFTHFPGHPFACDIDKRYAAILMKFILDRYGIHVPEEECRWTLDERDEFVRGVCEGLFSEAVYTEIHQILKDGYVPEFEPRSPRKNNETEARRNEKRGCDDGDSLNMVSNMWCVSGGCNRAMRTNCVNLSCHWHCHENGRKVCRPHQNFSVRPLAVETERKRVLTRNRRRG